MSDPGAPTYPVATIAKLLCLTPRRVQQLSQEGVIPRAERGRYELAPSVQGYVRYLQERIAGNSKTPYDYHTEKARLVRAQADRAEAELAELNGNLVSAADVAEQWGHLLANMKSRLLAIPSKTAPKLLQKERIDTIQMILDEAMTEVLTEFVGYGEQGAEHITVENGSGSAATAVDR